MSCENAPEPQHPLFAATGAHIVARVLFVLGAVAFLPVVPCLTAAYLITDRARAGSLQSLGFVAGAVGVACWALSGALLNEPG